ncbi:hypothetical protein FJZ31_11605 [Candidatus Poribacteria bacterium]|nr:hypothetical protein [Candidatus Poribacteria bacterium]
MQEVEFARETLRFAQMFLHMGVTHTWLYRILMGRLYYATHHLGRRLLIEIGLQPEQWRANVHQRVLDELYHQFVATRRMSLDAWTALEELRGLRRRADYELATPVRLKNVNRAVSLFTLFAEECYQILGVN